MKKLLRVAMIIQGYYPRVGGAERQLAALAPRLQAAGIDVHVLTRRYPGLAPFEQIGGVPVHRLPVPGPKPVASLVFTMAALPLLRRLRVDVIHAHELFSPATTAVTAKRVLGTPVVAKVLRGGMLGDVARLKRKVLGGRRLATFRQHIDAFITISREIEQELAGLGIPQERCRFIPNGVDVERFAPLPPAEKGRLRAVLNLPAGPVVVFTGRLEPEKRLHHLVTAWPAVQAACPGGLLLILGTGSQEASLRQTAGPGVRFAGPVADVAPYLQAADLFVLPSVTEGLSNALLEAMATGLPAIATSVGGAPDVIEHGRTGWLIPPDDSLALEEALVTLLGDEPHRRSLGQTGRARVRQDYALPVVADRLQALYQTLVPA